HDVGGVPRRRRGHDHRRHHAGFRQEEDEHRLDEARSHDGIPEKRRRLRAEESAMNRAAHPPESREPEELERDIDRTRSSLGRTIDELESRLSPGQLIDQVLSTGRQHGGEFAANLGRSVENNPLPLLLTAVGIAWMMMSSNEPRASRSSA